MIGMDAIQYGLQHPVIKTGGPWVVVGSTAFPHFHPDKVGEVQSLDIHLDDDDPLFEFATSEEWPELPRRVIDQYNAPYRKAGRLALRRAVNMGPHDALMMPHYAARARMEIVRAGRGHGHNVLTPYGGIVREEGDDAASGREDRALQAAFFAAVDCWRARRDSRFGHADVARDAIRRSGFDVTIERSGAVMFWAVA